MAQGEGGGAKPLVICVGDIHGYHSKLQNLWTNLALCLGPDAFASATVIFLGDYCDRGPDTAPVLDFLASLPSQHPGQRHAFLCGNHDFAFAAFLGVLPPPPPPGFHLASTWDEFKPSEEREGWWSGPGHEDMHVQGRRWAGTMRSKYNARRKMDFMGSTYDASPTFESYGLPHGDPGLREKVPLEHKKFLQNLVWVHEEEGIDTEKDSGPAFSRLIAIHAGLEKSKPVDAQMETLYKRDVTIPKIEALSGRSNVWATPPELAKEGVLVVSGHHGTLHVEDHRLIIDEGGGYEDRPIAAIILPSRIIVRDTDKL